MSSSSNNKRGSPFDFTQRDRQMFEQSYLTLEMVKAQGWWRAADSINGFDALGHKPTALKDYNGIVIVYTHPITGLERERVLRLDNPGHDAEGKEQGKYRGPIGRTNMFYIPLGVAVEWLRDISIPVVFVEGEKKALALWRIALENMRDGKPLFIPIGLRGVWGWIGKTGNRDLPGPGHERENGPLNDFDFLEWKGRVVYILYDSNLHSPKEKTRENIRAARRGLSHHLHYILEAKVFFAEMTREHFEQGINGPDDLAGLQEPDAVLELIDNAIPAIKPTIKPETKEERQSKKEAFRQMAREQAAKEDEYTHARRRATSADFAALSVICAELQFSDKSRAGLQALIALSEGKRSFIWKYEHLYPYLRRYDAELFKATAETVIDQKTRRKIPSKSAKKARSRINGIVRGYLDAIDADQDRCCIKLAHTNRGTKHFADNGNEIFERSETTLPILAYLEEIDALAKADLSYSSRSKSIRVKEARLLAGRLSKYTPTKPPGLTPRQEIEMAMKRAAGNIKSVIEQMRAMEYEDWAIRQDLRKYLPSEFFELMLGEDLQMTFGKPPTVEDDPPEGDTPSESHVADSEKDNQAQSVDHRHFEPVGAGSKDFAEAVDDLSCSITREGRGTGD